MKYGLLFAVAGSFSALTAGAETNDIAVAHAAYMTGNFRAAVEHYERAGSSRRTRAETIDLARSYQFLQQPDRAEHLANGILAQAPRNTDALVVLGDAAASRGKWDMAAKNYAAATASDSPRPEIWLRLGQALQHIGKAQLAEFAFSVYGQSLNR